MTMGPLDSQRPDTGVDQLASSRKAKHPETGKSKIVGERGNEATQSAGAADRFERSGHENKFEGKVTYSLARIRETGLNQVGSAELGKIQERIETGYYDNPKVVAHIAERIAEQLLAEEE